MAAAVMTGQASAEAFTRFQRLAWTNLVFSVTRRCPLRCAHCVTASAPDAAFPVLDVDEAGRWAPDLAALAALGLRTVTFTGGEPTLALHPVATLARAARAAGLRTAVVTSGSWGASAPLTGRVIGLLGPAVDAWDFGYDAYHARHLALPAFIRAVAAACDTGAEVAVRLCEADAVSTQAVLAALEGALPTAVTVIVQPTLAVGRGADLVPDGVLEPAGGDGPLAPCLSTGPFVREDGSVGPCCAALGYGARGRHPLEYGGPGGLVAAWRRWRADPLLRLLRLAGFALPLRWLAEEGLLDPQALAGGHVCEVCQGLWDDDGRVAAMLRRRAEDPKLLALLDGLEIALFGAVWSETAAVPPPQGETVQEACFAEA